jgi:1-acyl-sn-glycerol-3-phosphate acyltransferase
MNILHYDSNKYSYEEVYEMMCFFRDKDVRFVAKDNLSRHIPLVSEMLRNQEHCMVPRKAKPMEAMAVIEAFGKRVVERNQIPIIFPEGTRTRTGDVGKFYSAGFRKLVESSNLPVVVCALDGGYKIRDLNKILTNLQRGCYRVKILKIYDNPKTKEECINLLDEAKELIQQELDNWRKLPTTQM